MVTSLLNGDETVAIMVEVDPDFFEEFRHPETISVQPLGRLRSDPRAVRFVLVDLDVNLLNETDRRAVVTVRETMKLVKSAKAIVSASGMKSERATPVV